MNRITISSNATDFYKLVLPVIWGLGAGGAIIVLFVRGLAGKQHEAPPLILNWVALFAWILGFLFLISTSAKWKKVSIDDSAIYVSTYSEEVAVPFTAIREVTGDRWQNTHPVTIHFRSPTPFGDKITFMPPMRFFSWGTHPVIEELRQKAKLG